MKDSEVIVLMISCYLGLVERLLLASENRAIEVQLSGQRSILSTDFRFFFMASHRWSLIQWHQGELLSRV